MVGARRRFLIVTGAALAGTRWRRALAAPAAAPDAYPDRTIRLVVPYAAGSQLDVAARLVATKLGAAVAQPVIVEDHPGAAGDIGAKLVAASAPDGYTLLVAGSAITVLPSTVGASVVDPVVAFAPVSKIAKVPLVLLVHPSLGVGTLAELIALAHREPGRIAYATFGVGSTPHLAAAILAREARIDLLHVPYVNTGTALTEVLTGQPPVYLALRGPIDAYVQNGALRALAVMSRNRMRTWPDVPTVAELGYPNAAVDPWNGVFAPAGTPPAIVARLYHELSNIMQQPDVQERFGQAGLEAMATAPDAFATEIKEAVARWPSVVKAMDLRPH
jgi:tripartite-type tricarboxylate transporter receptor subunit TctC